MTPNNIICDEATSTPALPTGRRGRIIRGCLIGCGAVGLSLLLLIGYGAWRVKKFTDEIFNFSTVVELYLQHHGFSAGAENLSGKGVWEFFRLFTRDVTITQSPTNNVYYFGNELTVNAPCGGDVLFFGKRCTVNQPLSGKLMFYYVDFFGGGKAEITIAENATLDKLIINQKVFTLRGDAKNIRHGFTHDFGDFWQVPDLKKMLPEKLGAENFTYFLTGFFTDQITISEPTVIIPPKEVKTINNLSEKE